jgi:threonine dehydrogenase-like Zn-dependent dehydrogenase
MKMKAVAVLEKGVVRVVDDAPMPVIGEYDALVRILACGFCNGTDLRIIDEQVTAHQLLQPYPTLLGHEAIGVIEKVGPKVRNLAPGEKHVFVRGGKTEGSRYTSTHGQMAEYGVLTDYAAMESDGEALPASARVYQTRVPDDFDIADGGIFLPLCECLSAVKNFGIDAGTDVLMYGAGPMGLAMMRYMHILGAKSVTVIDSVPERLQKAREVGKADRVINFAQEDADAALGGQLFDRVVDAVGLSSVLVSGSYHLKPFGVACSLGVLKKEDSLVNLPEVKNNTLIHMLNFPYAELERLEENMGYIQKGQINPKDFYSHVMPMADVNEAIRLVREKKTLKVILTM